jgi:hypothetical protein
MKGELCWIGFSCCQKMLTVFLFLGDCVVVKNEWFIWSNLWEIEEAFSHETLSSRIVKTPGVPDESMLLFCG